MRRGQHSAVVSGAVATSPWIVVSSGVVVMVVLFVVAYCSARGQGTEGEGGFHSADVAVSLTALPDEEDEPPAPTPEVVQRTPAPPVVPGLSPRSTDLRASKEAAEAEAEASRRAERPSPSPSTRSARPSARPDPAPPRSAVTGRYQVVGNWGDAFIGEVRLTNGGSAAESWSVRLVFPQGRLVTSWVESTEQGQARMTGGVFTYQGGVPIAPGGSAVLKFHLERTGSVTTPVNCSVNRSSCAGL